ncbi:MAG: DNA repair protein RadA [Flavobacteriales bacterium]|nr:DNA repair protein RadA [Flavobacteriales bacterium]
MAKIKTAFYCQNCGTQSPKWIGKCTSCNEWNTYVEEVMEKTSENSNVFGSKASQKNIAQPLDDITITGDSRIILKDKELNRVLGGGLVEGSIVLFGGEPGIGKSTLLLQLALQNVNSKILYVSGEESEQQIKMRAERVGETNSNCYILCETSLENIFKQIENIEPNILIIDSIQTTHTTMVEASSGSVSQIRTCAIELLKYAKSCSTAVFLIGHITKEGNIAGPKILEHMVDTVLHFEGDQNHIYRLLRTTKNRFGSTNELGIYEMVSTGLNEVNNPSRMLISERDDPVSGTSISVTIEGMRPLLIETQALVSSTAYSSPQRSANGFDQKRLNMLLAVLEKSCGFDMSHKDVFLNITGGITVHDPAIDLGVVCALLSSAESISLSNKICFAGEVGLSGEVRPVNRVNLRILEADKLGFEQIYISKYNQTEITASKLKIQIVEVDKIETVYNSILKMT